MEETDEIVDFEDVDETEETDDRVEPENMDEVRCRLSL